MLRYEKINLDNIDIFYNLQKEIWPDDPDYQNFYDKAIHPMDDYMAWLVYDDDCLVGITGVYTEDIDPDSIWLDWYGIVSKYRRKGYGAKVLLDTIEYCKMLKRYQYFRLDTTYYKDRPALFLYDKVMHLKEKYTIEDTKEKKNNFLIYSYGFNGKVVPWNNRYLGLREYYDYCK